jgi:flagellar biosynthesis activator protein FlaF
MMLAAEIYGKVANKISSPRELEADLLLDAARRLQSVQETWNGPGENLDAALRYNRKLWTLFMSAVTTNDNPLPINIRQNVANLGLFVCKQTLAILADPKPQNLGSLININREIAAGLLSRG